MTVIRRLARPLLAAAFVDTGLESLRHPGPQVDAARPLVTRATRPLGLPDDPELAVRANGAAMAAAGTLFGLGRMPRTSALVMAATLAPATWTTQAFWHQEDPEQRREQRRRFVQSAGLIGAALISAVDTQGRPGLAWRGRRAAERAERKAARAAHDVERAAARAARRGRRGLRHARASAHLGG